MPRAFDRVDLAHYKSHELLIMIRLKYLYLYFFLDLKRNIKYEYQLTLVNEVDITG